MNDQWTHVKTGNQYTHLGHVINATNLQSGQRMVLYERDGHRYVREESEFLEKFTKNA